MLSNAKTRAVIVQVVVVTAIIAFVALLIRTTIGNLETRGIPIGFDFLFKPSRLVISEALLTYKSGDPYWRAIITGIANTIFISAIVIVVSTIFGLILGITRLSSNPLASGTSRVWVEIARNSPPLVILIFLYSIWWQVFPSAGEAWTILPNVNVSMRGVSLPSFSIDADARGLMLLLIALVALLLCTLEKLSGFRRQMLLASAAAAVGGIWLAAPAVSIEQPTFNGSNFVGGWTMTPEISTILLGLVIYTSGFVAEIVRGGILSVGKGQWEAGYSLGLTWGQIIRLVVIPQMLRVIVPPMNSQYINVVKNSTLAIAVGYPDFLAVMNTIISKTSHSIEGVFIILAVYLAINLTLSSVANWYNRRIRIVER